MHSLPPTDEHCPGGSPDFICHGDSYCNACFVIHFYTGVPVKHYNTIVYCLRGVEVLQPFVTGCSSVGVVWASNGIAQCLAFAWLFVECGKGILQKHVTSLFTSTQVPAWSW